MLYPNIFGENLMDDWTNYFTDFDKELEKEMEKTGRHLYGRHAKNLMKTDVHENENSYELEIDLPGFKKDEIGIDLEDGFLTISAGKNLEKEEDGKKTGKLIRHERYEGDMQRSFYVGEEVKPEDITASFENGVLKLTVPKKEPEVEKKPEAKRIEIQ